MAIFPLYISTVELQHYATRAERRVHTPPLKKAIPQLLGPLFPLKPHSERTLIQLIQNLMLVNSKPPKSRGIAFFRGGVQGPIHPVLSMPHGNNVTGSSQCPSVPVPVHPDKGPNVGSVLLY